MNFTTRPSTAVSETTHDQFRPYWDSWGRHSREILLLKSNQAGLSALLKQKSFVGKNPKKVRQFFLNVWWSSLFINNILSNSPITKGITRKNNQLTSKKVNLSGNELNLNIYQNNKLSITAKIKVTIPISNDTNSNCNCYMANKINCPLQGNRFIKNIVY